MLGFQGAHFGKHCPGGQTNSLLHSVTGPFEEAECASVQQKENRPYLASILNMLLYVVGFRTCYPQIWHLGILSILSRRIFFFKKWQGQKGPCDPQPFALHLWKREINPPCEGYPTWTRREGDGESRAGKSAWTLLNSLVSFWLLLHHLLPLAQTPRSCQSFTNLFSTHLKSIEAFCSGCFGSSFSCEVSHVRVKFKKTNMLFC